VRLHTPTGEVSESGWYRGNVDTTLGTYSAGGLPVAGSGPLAMGDTVAERFEIRALLGQGGMGSVYRAYDRELDEDIALKVLRPDLAATPDALLRFRREVKLARRVTHPHVARTYDLGAHQGMRYLTMQLITGAPLGGLRPIADVLRFASQLAQALAAAHAVGVVHRDLKPANVLVEDERAIITDFGIACMADMGDGGGGHDALRTGSIAIGTPAYIAPEQLEGASVDGRADIYALGVVLYELVSGRLPFDGESPAGLALARLTRDPHPLRAGDAPEGVGRLVMEMLARHREARPDAHTVADRVARLRGGGSTMDEPIIERRSEIAPHRRIQVARIDADATTSALAGDLAVAIADALVGDPALEVIRSATPDATDAALELDVRAAAERVRVRMRVVDGGQVGWVGKLEGSLADPFALEDAVAAQAVGALRARSSMPPGGDRYEAARRLLDGGPVEVRRGIAALEHLLATEPKNAWVASLLAGGLVRMALLAGGVDTAAFARAEELALRALDVDRENGHSYHAIASIRWYKGENAEAVAAAREAIRRAPTLAEPHILLGRVLSWLGRVAEAHHELALAIRLDASARDAYEERIRLLALTGDRVAALEALDDYDRAHAGGGMPVRLRLCTWWRDRELARQLIERIDRAPTGAVWEQSRSTLVAYVDGDLITMRRRIEDTMVRLLGERVITRQRVFLRQVAIENLMLAEAPELAVRHLLVLADEPGFIDLLWLDRCPVLEPLRERPELASVRAATAERAVHVWGHR
jgi:eukaryotic-like serine/threonine-protein kinase